MPTLTERIAVVIEATTPAAATIKGFSGTVKKELGEVDKAAAGTRNQTGLLSKGLDKLGLSSIDASTALKTGVAAGATIAAVALVKFGKAGVDAFSRLTAEVDDFQDVAGGSAEQASRLVSAMHALDVDTSAGAKAFGILSKTIENTPGKLAAIGVEIAKNKDGTTDLQGTLLNVADAYNATGDAAKKNNLALTAFGKGGLALADVLEKGRTGLKALYAEADKHHQVFSQEDLVRGQKFRIATDELRQTFKGLELEVGEKLVPALTKSAQALQVIVERGDQAANAIGKVADLTVRNEWHGFQDVVHEIGVHLGTWSDRASKADYQTDNLATSAAAAAVGLNAEGDAAGDTAEALDAMADQQEKVNRLLMEVPGAGIDAADATLNVGDAIRDVTEKQKAYNDALHSGGVKSDEFKQAASDLSHSILDEQRAVISAADAAGTLAEKQALAAGKSFDTAQKAQAEIDSLQKLEKQFPQLTPVIENYIAELLKIPGTVNTDLTLRSQGSTYTPQRHDNLHRFAAGGVVPGPIGAAQLAVVHGGEEVLTASQRRSGSGMTVIVNMPPGSDGEDVVAAIQRYERRNTAAWRN